MLSAKSLIWLCPVLAVHNWGDSVPLLQSPFLGRKCPSHGGVVCIPSSNMGDFDLLGLKSAVVSNHLVTMECYYFLCQYFPYL